MIEATNEVGLREIPVRLTLSVVLKVEEGIILVLPPYDESKLGGGKQRSARARHLPATSPSPGVATGAARASWKRPAAKVKVATEIFMV